jgi:Arc/MetJ-type ribon-helix-helix transcriptional regulator
MDVPDEIRGRAEPTDVVTHIDTQMQHNTVSDSESPTKTTVNIRMTEDFLASVDEAWRSEGFDSRSEFVRAVLRDAVKHPSFNRADLKAMLTSEVEFARGESHRSEEVKERFGVDASDGEPGTDE